MQDVANRQVIAEGQWVCVEGSVMDMSGYKVLALCEYGRVVNLRSSNMCRVGRNCIYTPYMTAYLVISLPKIPFIHRIYMVLANSKYVESTEGSCV